MSIICVDAVGGDEALDKVLEGCERALEQSPQLSIVLCGPKELIEDFAQRHERVEAVFCSERIEMADHPVQAVKTKKDSSIVRAAHLLKEGKAQGFFSAGSTGAILAAATLITGRIKGVKRPAITMALPLERPLVFCDLGANADCKAEYLYHFARMATLYSQIALGCSKPQLGLLNNGAEETKGSSFAQECNSYLKEHLPNFAGNAEPTDLFSQSFDIIVSDGFTGNICLKTIESTAKFLMLNLKNQFMSSLLSKLAALIMKKKLSKLKALLSADTYGGALLLGIKAPVLIGHGHTSAQAVCAGILETQRLVECKLVESIAQEFEELRLKESGLEQHKSGESQLEQHKAEDHSTGESKHV